ncbi:MAG: lipid-A-disaccharide synthase N-terminal domain-containing protein [Phycisphaerae bacterium]|nr:lipid-A-disaccharide synthase N-terminal domain-containing protein [Phycisphaerae bacterium]
MWQQVMQKLDWIAAVGFVAQVLFFGRFLVQWIASERSGRSVVPVSFWYLSILGSLGLLFYAIMRADPVFILGQSLGMVIYVRNLMLISRERSAEKKGPVPG